jgi:hypothetical protein
LRYIKCLLSDYAELLRALDKLPEQLGKLTDKNKDFKDLKTVEVLKMVPTFLADSWQDIVALLAVPTDKDAAFLAKIDGADAIDVIDAILELNDFARIQTAIKKILARRNQATQPKPAQ